MSGLNVLHVFVPHSSLVAGVVIHLTIVGDLLHLGLRLAIFSARFAPRQHTRCDGAPERSGHQRPVLWFVSRPGPGSLNLTVQLHKTVWPATSLPTCIVLVHPHSFDLRSLLVQLLSSQNPTLFIPSLSITLFLFTHLRLSRSPETAALN